MYRRRVSSAHGGTRRPMQSRLCIICYGYYLIGGLQFDSVCAHCQIHRDRRPNTPACSGCWAMETNKVKKCTVRKIIFCTGLTRAAKAGRNSIVPARRVQRTNQGRTPFICTLWVPIHLSFNSQQGPLFSSLSGCCPPPLLLNFPTDSSSNLSKTTLHWVSCFLHAYAAGMRRRSQLCGMHGALFINTYTKNARISQRVLCARMKLACNAQEVDARTFPNLSARPKWRMWKCASCKHTHLMQ